MTRSVWRKRLKVIGLLLSIMLLGLWVFSVVFTSRYIPPTNQWSIIIANGRIFIVGPVAGNPESGWTFYPVNPEWKVRLQKIVSTKFIYRWLGFGLPWFQPPHTPVWLLLVATGFPTAILWWRDRRPKARFCQVCKYDLTGNVSGTCPECGEAVKR